MDDDRLGRALSVPHILDVSTRRSESGDWVCHLEYAELDGCASEARDVLDALDQVERRREQWLRDRLASGQEPPTPRAPLSS